MRSFMVLAVLVLASSLLVAHNSMAAKGNNDHAGIHSSAVVAGGGSKANRTQANINADRANLAKVEADKARIDASNESAARIAHRDQKFDAAIANFNHKIAGELQSCPTCQ